MPTGYLGNAIIYAVAFAAIGYCIWQWRQEAKRKDEGGR